MPTNSPCQEKSLPGIRTSSFKTLHHHTTLPNYVISKDNNISSHFCAVSKGSNVLQSNEKTQNFVKIRLVCLLACTPLVLCLCLNMPLLKKAQFSCKHFVHRSFKPHFCPQFLRNRWWNIHSSLHCQPWSVNSSTMRKSS